MQSRRRILSRPLGIGVGLVVPLILSAVAARASDKANVRGMGMARSSVAVARGLDAVGINPANLAFPAEELMTITVLPVGGYMTSDFFTYEIYSRYLKDHQVLANLSQADKDELLGSFHDDKGRMYAEAVARLFGIGLRINRSSSVVFTVDYGLIGAGIIPREYARLLLYGKTPGTSFALDGPIIQAYWGRTYTLSYGMDVPAPAFLQWLAAGVGVKAVEGYGYYGVERFDAQLQSNNDGAIDGKVSALARWTTTNPMSDPLHNLFQRPAGFGYGVDVGLAAGLNDLFSIAVSVTDIGALQWSRDIKEYSSDSVIAGGGADVFKHLRSLGNTDAEEAHDGTPFRMSLPGRFHVGVSARVNDAGRDPLSPGKLIFAAEYQRGIGRDAPLQEPSRFSLGIEHCPSGWLALRTGFSVGGHRPHLSFGMGVQTGPFDFDLATEDVFWLFSGQRFSTGSAGFAFRFRFGK